MELGALGFRGWRFRGYRAQGFRVRSIYTTLPLWNLVPKDHPYYGFGGPTSIMVVYVNPVGNPVR